MVEVVAGESAVEELVTSGLIVEAVVDNTGVVVLSSADAVGVVLAVSGAEVDVPYWKGSENVVLVVLDEVVEDSSSPGPPAIDVLVTSAVVGVVVAVYAAAEVVELLPPYP